MIRILKPLSFHNFNLGIKDHDFEGRIAQNQIEMFICVYSFRFSTNKTNQLVKNK